MRPFYKLFYVLSKKSQISRSKFNCIFAKAKCLFAIFKKILETNQFALPARRIDYCAVVEMNIFPVLLKKLTEIVHFIKLKKLFQLC